MVRVSMRARYANDRRRQAQITGRKPELGESIAIFEVRWSTRAAPGEAGGARRGRRVSRRRCRAAGRAQ
ncbi:hypothetical protein BFF94_004765 [Burkholderia catarinensis]|nr:hypothetical protein BFF94_004765 [Burkholderia catarinensis]